MNKKIKTIILFALIICFIIVFFVILKHNKAEKDSVDGLHTNEKINEDNTASSMDSYSDSSSSNSVIKNDDEKYTTVKEEQKDLTNEESISISYENKEDVVFIESDEFKNNDLVKSLHINESSNYLISDQDLKESGSNHLINLFISGKLPVENNDYGYPYYWILLDKENKDSIYISKYDYSEFVFNYRPFFIGSNPVKISISNDVKEKLNLCFDKEINTEGTFLEDDRFLYLQVKSLIIQDPSVNPYGDDFSNIYNITYYKDNKEYFCGIDLSSLEFKYKNNYTIEDIKKIGIDKYSLYPTNVKENPDDDNWLEQCISTLIVEGLVYNNFLPSDTQEVSVYSLNNVNYVFINTFNSTRLITMYIPKNKFEPTYSYVDIDIPFVLELLNNSNAELIKTITNPSSFEVGKLF